MSSTCSSFNALSLISRDQRKQFNASRLSKLGEMEVVKDDFLATYEICTAFAVANEEYCQRQDSPYVGDDGFPDAYNHEAWKFNTALYDVKANEFTIARSQKVLAIIKQSRGK